MYQNRRCHPPTPSAKLAITLVTKREELDIMQRSDWMTSRLWWNRFIGLPPFLSWTPELGSWHKHKPAASHACTAGWCAKNRAGVFGRRRLIRYSCNKVLSELWWADNVPGNLCVVKVNGFQITETAHPLRSASRDKCIDQGVFKAPPTTPR